MPPQGSTLKIRHCPIPLSDSTCGTSSMGKSAQVSRSGMAGFQKQKKLSKASSLPAVTKKSRLQRDLKSSKKDSPSQAKLKPSQN